MDALVPETEADRVQIFAETVLDIAFTIAAAQSVAAADVATIAAYPVAAGQVRASLAALFPNAEVVLASSNAAAAADVAAGLADAAVTTPGRRGSQRPDGPGRGVADSDDAATRFVFSPVRVRYRPAPARTAPASSSTSPTVPAACSRHSTSSPPAAST